MGRKIVIVVFLIVIFFFMEKWAGGFQERKLVLCVVPFPFIFNVTLLQSIYISFRVIFLPVGRPWDFRAKIVVILHKR